MSPLSWTEPLRKKLRNALLSPVKGPCPPSIDFTQGDAGLFGPQSATWQVHADYPSMLIGGVSAIMLQALQPLAMAGVYEHSNFREDPFGRLRRTATFLAGTVFGSSEKATSLIEMVHRIHLRVVGTAPDGRPYSANDPALLTWIHTAEVWSFLQAYQRYSLRPLTGDRQDQYIREIAQIAERLGAEGVPHSVTEVEGYFARLLPSLTYGEQAREALTFLRKTPAPNRAMAVGFHIIFEAATELLPNWARALLGEQRPVGPRLFRPALLMGCEAVRWAVRDAGVIDLAIKRTTSQ
jgi:uncharacterized protein (DUF2236 family)